MQAAVLAGTPEALEPHAAAPLTAGRTSPYAAPELLARLRAELAQGA